ncbi:MAG TPA: catalase [Xanthobacteraceae bacterium]|nr:catalase [Xanthobacteraceae bacterium]
MSDRHAGRSRRDVLAAMGGLSVAGAVGPAMAAPVLITPVGPPDEAGALRAETGGEATATAVVDALEGAYGAHRGQRRNHTKGIGALGTFVGRPEGAAYSRSALFSGQTIEVVARFSLAGGDPQASDTEKSPRGLGLEFRLPNGALHHMTMIHTPMFFAAVPATFLDKFIALAPDPATGKPNPDKLKAFMVHHPDNAGQAAFLEDNNPPPSYANCAFYGIHTFKFIDGQDNVTLVRFRFVPQDGEKRLSDTEVKTMRPDFLRPALAERLRRGPAQWDMILTIGEPGDPEDDPTILWPPNRKEVRVGTLGFPRRCPRSRPEATASISIR